MITPQPRSTLFPYTTLFRSSCKSKLKDGRVIHGAHQHKALSEAEEAAGLILTCCATPQTDCVVEARMVVGAGEYPDRKSTRLNSSHTVISYAVFCLKKKNKD